MAENYNAVGWFEIPAVQLDRAKEFYEALPGVQLEYHEMGPLRMAWFPMKEGAPGTMGSL
jgi:predicted enzyme related to lactoylglutathione lyase